MGARVSNSVTVIVSNFFQKNVLRFCTIAVRIAVIVALLSLAELAGLMNLCAQAGAVERPFFDAVSQELLKNNAAKLKEWGRNVAHMSVLTKIFQAFSTLSAIPDALFSAVQDLSADGRLDISNAQIDWVLLDVFNRWERAAPAFINSLTAVVNTDTYYRQLHDHHYD